MCIGFHSQRQLCTVVVRVHGEKARSASNNVALVAMSSGDSGHLHEQEWAEVLHRGSERMTG